MLADTAQNKKVEQKTQNDIDVCARNGLRTLSYAYRILTEEEYSVWHEAHMTAAMAIKNRAEVSIFSSLVSVFVIFLSNLCVCNARW